MVAIARRGAADSLAAGITTTADYSFSGARPRRRQTSSACARSSTSRSSAPTRRRPRSAFDELRASASPETRARADRRSRRTRPYTCSVDVYRWCLSLGIPVGTHLAESAAENEWLEHGTGPMAANARRARRADRQAQRRRRSPTCSAPSFSARTASTSTHDEIALLARHDVPVAHCPRSNALLGCGIAPLAELRAAALRVGLGTDSPASTPSFDLWEELRTAVYMSRAREQRPDALDAHDALRLATLDAARALGLDDEVGSLTPGKQADLTVLSVAGSPYDPVEDPSVAAVFGGSPAGVLETIVDGQTRYRQGETAWQEVRSTASAARGECCA